MCGDSLTLSLANFVPLAKTSRALTRASFAKPFTFSLNMEPMNTQRVRDLSLGHHDLDLEKPTGTRQLLGTVKAIGLISNILTRVYVHGIRQGAAKDIIHLLEKPSCGQVNNEVQEAIFYSNATFHSGVT
jgi:hypothetical protein